MSDVICPVCGKSGNCVYRRNNSSIPYNAGDVNELYMGNGSDYGFHPKDDKFYICHAITGCATLFYPGKIIRRGWDYLIPIDPKMVR